MTDERVDPKVIRAHSEAFRRAYIEGSPYDVCSEAAIHAADRERGLKEEFSIIHEDGRRQETNMASALALTFHPSGRRMESRLVSDWREVERGGKDG